MLHYSTVLPRTPTPPGGRRAAIAACFWIEPSTGAASLLFIRRAINQRDPWSGNVALPGGKQDPSDGDDDEVTAVRETREEVGLDLHSWRRLGRLTADHTIYPRGKPLTVSLFGFAADGEGATSGQPQLRPQACEVADAWWVPASVLCPESLAWHTMPVEQFWPGLRQRPALLALCRACGGGRVRYAALPLPPPPPPPPYHHDRPPVAKGSKGLEEGSYLLWGLTLGFLSDARRRSALAKPLVGEGAAGQFHQPFRSGGGGPLIDAALRALFLGRNRSHGSHGLGRWRWPVGCAALAVVLGLIKARLAWLRIG